MEENNQLNTEVLEKSTKPKEKLSKRKFKIGKFIIPGKFIVIGLILIAVLVFGSFVIRNFVIKPDIKTEITSSIQDTFAIDELSTLKYYYNAVVHKTNEKGKDLYHVSYQGYVTAGIEFEKPEISVDENSKLITITIPEAKIIDRVVDPGSLDFIFVNNSAKTDTINTQAYQLAKEDLIKRTAEDSSILEIASQNAIDAIYGLLEPWLKEVYSEYSLEIKLGEKNEK